MIVLWFSCAPTTITVERAVHIVEDGEETGAPEAEVVPQPEETPAPEEEEEIQEEICPAGMRPVPSEDPDFCLDMFEAEVRDGLAYSEVGQLPSTLFSFEEAQEICAATPVLNAQGDVVAYKRLVSLSEWSDAADGVVGDGGTSYSYGDEWQDDACATPRHDGAVVYDEIQRSGAFPACVSEFGIFDQIGNVWEWADPQKNIDIDAFFARVEQLGFVGYTTAENQIYFEGDIHLLWLDAAGAQNRLTQGEDGLLYASEISDAIASNDMDVQGYIRVNFNGPGVHGEFAPIRVQKEPAANGLHPIEVLWERDGASLTAKAGCAYYVGDWNSCRIESVQSSHSYDFIGSIGFRCALDYPFE